MSSVFACLLEIEPPAVAALPALALLASNAVGLAAIGRATWRLRCERALRAAACGLDPDVDRDPLTGPPVHRDPLTGLPTRRLFRDRLAQSLSLADREGKGVALLCIELDGFQALAQLIGGPAAQRLLREIANRLVATARDTDAVARLGPASFGIVQPLGGTPREAWAMAQRLLAALSEPFPLDGRLVAIAACIGIALHPTNGGSADMLIGNAETALGRVKPETGSGGICFFEQQMNTHLHARHALEHDLRHALERDELLLHYQPLFDSRSLRIVGYEALLRWRHPTRGTVSPAEFIPLAEECGLIAPIGSWVLRTACAEASLWSRPLRVAVNLSPIQFRNRDLALLVAGILAETGLPASRLELEVTEGVLIDDTTSALAILRELKAQGIAIALDDFGTGYSSLSYLRSFPFDKLKIDRSFVRELGEDREADAIVRSILALCRSLNLDVTAEGVETPEQLALLREQDCSQVQGFLLGRPVGREELAHALV